MTQQEQQLLNGLIERVNGTQVANKDGEAENLLKGRLASNPDALYILCQTVLVQQFALDNAQRQLTAARAELDQVKQQADKPQEHGSFLGNLFGLGKSDDKPAQQSSYDSTAGQPTGYQPVHAPTQYGAPQQGYGQPAGYPQQPPPQGYGYPGGYAQPAYGGAPMGGGIFGGGGGGFLQGAMQTAAGVVAGEFAFRAIEDVFHGFGGGGGRGFEGGSTEVVNNYYGSDDASGRDGSNFGDRLASADGYNGGISPDIEDRRGESQGFLGGDTGDRSAFADNGSNDDDNRGDFTENSSDFADAGGGYDDGGGDFSGGSDDNNF